MHKKCIVCVFLHYNQNHHIHTPYHIGKTMLMCVPYKIVRVVYFLGKFMNTWTKRHCDNSNAITEIICTHTYMCESMNSVSRLYVVVVYVNLLLSSTAEYIFKICFAAKTVQKWKKHKWFSLHLVSIINFHYFWILFDYSYNYEICLLFDVTAFTMILLYMYINVCMR